MAALQRSCSPPGRWPPSSLSHTPSGGPLSLLTFTHLFLVPCFPHLLLLLWEATCAPNSKTLLICLAVVDSA